MTVQQSIRQSLVNFNVDLSHDVFTIVTSRVHIDLRRSLWLKLAICVDNTFTFVRHELAHNSEEVE